MYGGEWIFIIKLRWLLLHCFLTCQVHSNPAWCVRGCFMCGRRELTAQGTRRSPAGHRQRDITMRGPIWAAVSPLVTWGFRGVQFWFKLCQTTNPRCIDPLGGSCLPAGAKASRCRRQKCGRTQAPTALVTHSQTPALEPHQLRLLAAILVIDWLLVIVSLSARKGRAAICWQIAHSVRIGGRGPYTSAPFVPLIRRRLRYAHQP